MLLLWKESNIIKPSMTTHIPVLDPRQSISLVNFTFEVRQPWKPNNLISSKTFGLGNHSLRQALVLTRCRGVRLVFISSKLSIRLKLTSAFVPLGLCIPGQGSNLCGLLRHSNYPSSSLSATLMRIRAFEESKRTFFPRPVVHSVTLHHFEVWTKTWERERATNQITGLLIGPPTSFFICRTGPLRAKLTSAKKNIHVIRLRANSTKKKASFRTSHYKDDRSCNSPSHILTGIKNEWIA